MYPDEKSLPHLLWCILVALRTVEEDKPFINETGRRRFISEWLDLARDNPNFRGMASEFTSLRELLETTEKKAFIADTLSTLLDHAYAAENCDLFRFRSALNQLLLNGWKHTVCRFPENISAELMTRRKGNSKHALQLTRTENAFKPVGNMVQPITFQLLFSRKDLKLTDVEMTFVNAGFQVVVVRDQLELAKERLIRTLHVGLPSLSENDWNPRECDIWKPASAGPTCAPSSLH